MNCVGVPRFIQSVRSSSYTFRSTDIGVVQDLMIHDIDLVNTAFPGNLTDCRASGISVFGGKEDIAQARLQFSCGAIANLTASRCSFVNERSLQIFGTTGFAAVDCTQQTVKSIEYPDWIMNSNFDFNTLAAEQREYVKQNLFTELLKVQESKVEPTNAILKEQQQWVSRIFKGTPMVNMPENACEAVAIADRVIKEIESHDWQLPEPAASTIGQIPAELQPAAKHAA